MCVGILGVQGWRWWQHSQAEQASVLYSAISTATRANDLPKAKDAMAQLADKYSGTGYAPRGAMIVARMLFDSGDKAGAKAQLQWVIDRSGEEELKQIARYRLAEVQFDEKQYDDALRMLDAKHDEPFAGLYADLRGDILAAAKRNDEARTAYQTALAKVDAKSQYRNYIEVKLNALGGPLSAAAASTATPIAGVTAARTPVTTPMPGAPVTVAPAIPAAIIPPPSSVTPAAPASATPGTPASATPGTPASATPATVASPSPAKPASAMPTPAAAK